MDKKRKGRTCKCKNEGEKVRKNNARINEEKKERKKRKTAHKHQESLSVLIPRKYDLSLELNKAVIGEDHS